MSTLQDVLNYLPRVLSKRYSEKFWVNAANKVLNDIEKKMRLPRVTEEFGLVLEKDITNYPIPNYVKKVLGVYKVGHPNTSRGRANEVKWETRGKMIQVDDIFDAKDEITLENGLIEAGATKFKLLSNDASDSHKNLLIVCNDGDNEGYTSMIQKVSEGTPGSYVLKRPLPFEPLAGELFNIHECFLIVEYIKGFEKVKDLVCDIVDDEDLLIVVENGLRYYGELQTDEESEYAIRWSNQYRTSLKSYVNFHTRHLFKQQPKISKPNFNAITGDPSRLYGNNSGVYGDPEAQG